MCVVPFILALVVLISTGQSVEVIGKESHNKMCGTEQQAVIEAAVIRAIDPRGNSPLVVEEQNNGKFCAG